MLVWKLDRLSRSLRDLLNVIEETFTPNGVSLISATESIDTSTPGGRAMLAVLGTFAQFEREQDAERVTMVHNQLAQDCRYLGGTVPLGFKIVDKHYQIDEQTAPIVRHCFELYVSNVGYSGILRYLNSTGRRTSTGREFTKGSLITMFSNEKYAGVYIHNRSIPSSQQQHKRTNRSRPADEIIRIPGGIPAIIDSDTWQRACAIRAENQRVATCRSKYSSKYPYLLSGLCRCAVCSQTMIIVEGGRDRNGTTQRYYQCKRRCVPSARVERVEEAALDAMSHIAVDEDLLIRACNLANELTAASVPDNTAEVAALKQHLQEIETQQSNLTDALCASGKVAPPSILSRLERLDREKESIERKIKRLERSHYTYDPEYMLKAANTLRTCKKLPPEEQKCVLQAAIKDVYIGQSEYHFIMIGQQLVEVKHNMLCTLRWQRPTASTMV